MSSPNATAMVPPTTPPFIIHINLSPTLGADFIGVVLASMQVLPSLSEPIR